MMIIAFSGASLMAAKGIRDADNYEDYEDFDHDYEEDEKGESITILRHHPDGTVEVEQE